jgi:hypothetical protein
MRLGRLLPEAAERSVALLRPACRAAGRGCEDSVEVKVPAAGLA